MKKLSIILLTLLIASNAFGVTQLKKTVMPSGGDYTSLEACMNANEQNLVTADQYFDVEIDGSWSSSDTTAVTIHNYTTDATRYINIYTTAAARHLGIWSSSYYNLSTGNVNAFYIVTSAVDLKVTGLQIYRNGTGNASLLTFGPTLAMNLTVSKCIIKGGSYPVKIESLGTIYIINTLMYGGSSGGYVDVTAASTVNIYSCVAVGASYGFRRLASTLVTKNCYAAATGVGNAYTGTITKTTCASDDATGSAGLQNIAYDTDTFVNVTGGSEDLHLATDGLSPLVNVGTDTSGEGAPLNFTDDIDGVTRSGTWDVGADEYVTTNSQLIFINEF